MKHKIIETEKPLKHKVIGRYGYQVTFAGSGVKQSQKDLLKTDEELLNDGYVRVYNGVWRRV